jgi:hypothetical protein
MILCLIVNYVVEEEPSKKVIFFVMSECKNQFKIEC